MVSGSALVENKVHVIPSTTGGTSISDERASSLSPGGGLVLEGSGGLNVLSFA